MHRRRNTVLYAYPVLSVYLRTHTVRHYDPFCDSFLRKARDVWDAVPY